MTNNQKNMYIETVLLFNKKTWKGSGRIKRCIRLCITGARATSGGDGPRGADWGDRVGGLKGVAWGHLRAADVDVGVPRGARAPRPVGTGPEGADWGDRIGA